MIISNDEQLVKLKKIGKIVGNCLAHVGKSIKPGMTTKEVDAIAEAYLTERGARSAPVLSYNFPGWTCISINDEVAHGIPGNKIIQEGDLVNVDVSAELDGIFADTGGSFPIGKVKRRKKDVCRATKTALNAAMLNAKSGQRLNKIGEAIERVAKLNKLYIIRDLGSHGVGLALHEEPKFIPSYYDPEDTRLLVKGMVITIEPFLTTGSPRSHTSGDGWTILNDEDSITAQYEHTMVITDGAPLVVTHPDL